MKRNLTSGNIPTVSQADSTDYKFQNLSALPLMPTSMAPNWVELAPSLLNHVLCPLLSSDKQSVSEILNVDCNKLRDIVMEVRLYQVEAMELDLPHLLHLDHIPIRSYSKRQQSVKLGILLYMKLY
jgi:hypothetical protein